TAATNASIDSPENTAELGEEQALSPVILSNANAQAESSNSSFQSPYTAATNASIDSP
ncbi:unnamed protein product, partial [Penicillium egyptiacum]